MASTPSQLASQKRWRDKNKEACRERCRQYRLKNLERLRAAGRANGKRRYWGDPEAAAVRNRQQRRKHLSKRIAADRAYREAHAEQHRAKAKRWYHDHKNDERYKELRRRRDIPYQQRRRALKKCAAVNLAAIKAWMLKIRSQKKATCYHCQAVVPGASVHFDHIVPLSKGGPHSIENLCVACEPCNRSKSDKPLRAWIKIGQQVLEL